MIRYDTIYSSETWHRPIDVYITCKLNKTESVIGNSNKWVYLYLHNKDIFFILFRFVYCNPSSRNTCSVYMYQPSTTSDTSNETMTLMLITNTFWKRVVWTSAISIGPHPLLSQVFMNRVHAIIANIEIFILWGAGNLNGTDLTHLTTKQVWLDISVLCADAAFESQTSWLASQPAGHQCTFLLMGQLALPENGRPYKQILDIINGMPPIIRNYLGSDGPN